MKTILKTIAFLTIGLAIALGSCKKKFEKYPANPNVPGDADVIPPEYLLRQCLYEIHRGGGVEDGRPGAVPEDVFQETSRWSQYTTGLTFPLYGGTNEYNWTNTASPYSILRNTQKLEEQAINAFGEDDNPYLGVSKFIKAYLFIWYTQRVGDIPMSEAGQGLENPTPKFDTQQEVYEQCLQLLEDANSYLSGVMNGIPATNLSGDFFHNGDLLKWRKTINAFTLRTLISLSKRANDSPSLRISDRFAAIVNNPTDYPIFESNDDNFSFIWVPVVNRPDVRWRGLFSDETTVASTILDITTSVNDPRTFLFATPAPAELDAGKSIDDFSAYVGSPNGVPQGTLFQEAADGQYSYINYIHYLENTIDDYPEDKVILGYAEQCFNIAEAINRGWIGGNDAQYYMQGIEGHLAFLGLSDGAVLEVGNVNGASYGTVTVSVSDFLSHPDVTYQGGQSGLEQILTQKYVAFWQNGTWEAFYQYRRTGVPEFSVGGGTNPQGEIPKRWQYPPSEVQNNPNASQAISSQYGSDNIFAEMWLIKD